MLMDDLGTMNLIRRVKHQSQRWYWQAIQQSVIQEAANLIISEPRQVSTTSRNILLEPIAASLHEYGNHPSISYYSYFGMR